MTDSAAPLVERVRARLANGAGTPSPVAVAALVREEAGGLLGDRALLTAVRAATDELAGAGVLEPLLRTPGVTDVLVNGPDEVWIDRGAGLEAVDVRFPDEAAVRRLAVRLAAAPRPRVGRARPPGGARAGGRGGRGAGAAGGGWGAPPPGGAAGRPAAPGRPPPPPPVSGSGTCLSLRVLRRAVLSAADLTARGAFPGPAAAL